MSVSIITQNEKMRGILDKLRKVVESDSSVLLIGETGVGKEIFAEYIHRSSPRSANPMVKIGLAALPADLMASELFGHEKGAFTNAINSKKGLFEMADTGSIFLDDIDDVPLNIQTKLLRVLESRELMRIGGTKAIPINTRLISAAKVDLKEMVKRNLFRADFLYRINVVTIEIPPLRERRDDIPLLVKHFIKRFASGRGISISKDALQALIAYHWPGNIRELRNVVQRASLFADGEIKRNDLPDEFRVANSMNRIVQDCTICFEKGEMSLAEVVDCVEKNLLNQTLADSGMNQSDAARTLQMSLSTFRDKLKKHHLNGHALPQDLNKRTNTSS